MSDTGTATLNSGSTTAGVTNFTMPKLSVYASTSNSELGVNQTVNYSLIETREIAGEAGTATFTIKNEDENNATIHAESMDKKLFGNSLTKQVSDRQFVAVAELPDTLAPIIHFHGYFHSNEIDVNNDMAQVNAVGVLDILNKTYIGGKYTHYSGGNYAWYPGADVVFNPEINGQIRGNKYLDGGATTINTFFDDYEYIGEPTARESWTAWEALQYIEKSYGGVLTESGSTGTTYDYPERIGYIKGVSAATTNDIFAIGLTESLKIAEDMKWGTPKTDFEAHTLRNVNITGKSVTEAIRIICREVGPYQLQCVPNADNYTSTTLPTIFRSLLYLATVDKDKTQKYTLTWGERDTTIDSDSDFEGGDITAVRGHYRKLVVYGKETRLQCNACYPSKPTEGNWTSIKDEDIMYFEKDWTTANETAYNNASTENKKDAKYDNVYQAFKTDNDLNFGLDTSEWTPKNFDQTLYYSKARPMIDSKLISETSNVNLPLQGWYTTTGATTWVSIGNDKSIGSFKIRGDRPGIKITKGKNGTTQARAKTYLETNSGYLVFLLTFNTQHRVRGVAGLDANNAVTTNSDNITFDSDDEVKVVYSDRFGMDVIWPYLTYEGSGATYAWEIGPNGTSVVYQRDDRTEISKYTKGLFERYLQRQNNGSFVKVGWNPSHRAGYFIDKISGKGRTWNVDLWIQGITRDYTSYATRYDFGRGLQ